MAIHLGRFRVDRGSAVRSLISVVLAVGSMLSTTAAPAGPPASAMEALAGPAAAADLHVMTFNLRYAGPGTPNTWAERRPVTRTLLRTELPDLIGTQEGLADQLHDIETDLGAGYDYIGRGRLGAPAASSWPSSSARKG